MSVISHKSPTSSSSPGGRTVPKSATAVIAGVESRITFISAGAGSGKTYRLTEILHDALVNCSARPSGIMATTFTKKAAAELESRVRRDLIERDKASLANAIGQALIGTVNSVCGRLLERFSFELGLPRQLRVLDEETAKAQVRRALDAAGTSELLDELSEVAERLGLSDWSEPAGEIMTHARLNGITAAQLRTMGQRNADDLLSNFPKASRRDLDAELHKVLRAAAPAAVTTAVTCGAKNAREYSDKLERMLQDLPQRRYRWSDWIKLADKVPASQRDNAEPVCEIAILHMEHAGLHADLRAYLSGIFTLVADALELYADNKRAAGMIDYADQEQLLLKALDDTTVQDVLRDELDLLLVDEFQDTSPIQLALFLRLAALAKRTYWVGDIKQAIYGFRGSDTELMTSLLGQLPNLGGTKEVLNRSWRSCPGLVAAVNSVFVPAFAPQAAADVELTAQRAEPMTNTAILHWSLVGKNHGVRARAMAQAVRHLVGTGFTVTDKTTGEKRPVQYGDIAVLARLNDRVRDLAVQFTAVGVPVATAQPGLLLRPEVVLMLACLRRLVDAYDTVASAEIISLTDGGDPEDWLSHRLDHIAAGTPAHSWREEGDGAHVILQTVASLRAQLGLLSPSEALQLVTTSAQLTNHVLKWAHNDLEARRMLANMEALLLLAGQYEEICASSRTVGTVAGLLTWLHELAKDENDVLADPGIDAVRLMNTHSAKGLEWPVVIVYDLDAKLRDNLWKPSAVSTAPVNAADPLANRFLRYWPWAFSESDNALASACVDETPTAQKCLAQAKDEAIRLLYVTMTRARDCMILATPVAPKSLDWLDLVGGECLLQGAPGMLKLPSGKRIGFDAATWSADDAAPIPPPTPCVLHWFAVDSAADPRAPSRLRETLSPSAAIPSAATAMSIVETCRTGMRLKLTGPIDMTVLGTAVHAAITANLAQDIGVLFPANTQAILQMHAMHHSLDCTELHGRIDALRSWITTRWPGATIRNEVPIQLRLATGQMLVGQIDLLIDTGSGWVVIDHKSNPEPESEWPRKVQEYSGQLAAYAKALVEITSRPVESTWLHFVVGGALVNCK